MVKNFFDLSGRVALVTGASRGLGQYFGRALAEAGADLVVTARKREDTEAFAAEIRALGRRVASVDLDVRDEASIKKMAPEAEAAFGKIDILVNNAGGNVRKPALDFTWEDWNRILDTNLRGTFFVAQAIAPGMIRQAYGRIVNIGSVTSVFGYGAIAPCRLRTLPPAVERDRGHDHTAGDDLLHPVREAALRAADLDHGHEDRAHQRAEDGAPAAEQAAAADDDRRDHVQLEPHRDRR